MALITSAYHVMVEHTVKGGPADRAGIVAGDHIWEINGKPAAEGNNPDAVLNGAVQRLTGPVGSQVILTVSHSISGPKQQIALTREIVQSNNAEQLAKKEAAVAGTESQPDTITGRRRRDTHSRCNASPGPYRFSA